MTLFQMLRQTGYEVSEGSFPDNINPNFPFILYEIDSTQNFEADNYVYSTIRNVSVYLCVDGFRPDTTARVHLESILNSAHIPWEMSDAYKEEEEGLFVTVYDLRWCDGND